VNINGPRLLAIAKRLDVLSNEEDARSFGTLLCH
jgi:hypothetical protein